MSCEYFVKKKAFAPRKIEKVQMFFANGDFVTLAKREIVDISVTFYDELRVGEMGFCPVAKSGFLKCRIKSSRKRGYYKYLVYERSEYGEIFKEYFENRCTREGGIRYMRIFDENSWHVPFYCIASARKQDDFLIFDFQEGVGCGTAESDSHFVRVRDVTKANIDKIDLDFENCDSFEIFPQEIQDMKLDFYDELEWGASSFRRRLRSGYIRLKLDKEITWRRSNVYWGKCKDEIRKLENRLCGKGKDVIDICHLYVTYDYAGYCTYLEECIEIDDIRPIEVQEDDEDGYVSGYAEKQKDGSVLIVFGKQT